MVFHVNIGLLLLVKDDGDAEVASATTAGTT